MSHNYDTPLFTVGTPPSNGIKELAEDGGQGNLKEAINQAIELDRAHDIFRDENSVSGQGTSKTVQLSVNESFPLVTIVSQISPSPDWFVGVRNLSLVGDSGWVDFLIVPVVAYDAGTDTGKTFTSANFPIPRDTIGYNNAWVLADSSASFQELGFFTFVKE